MTISIKMENCSYDEPAIIEESMDTTINLRISFPGQIPTAQSKNTVKATIIQLVQSELTKFRWICFGPAWIELTWFLDAADKQETDAMGDLDNITKPILDALTGLEGIIVDDSQIKSIYTRWLAKNAALREQILEISIQILNEEVLQKDKAYFIQYHNAMCFAVDLNPLDDKELKAIKLFAQAKLMQRSFSDNLQKLGADVRLPLVASQKDFHRTRLSKMPPGRIFRLSADN
jgi:Holliday junction resolvase RusA-like endonuclease